jgi:TRAP-type C4-dicarboxylate transport system permease small subunit
MVGGGVRLVALAFELDQISAAIGVRMGFVYLVLPVSGALIALFSLEAIAQGMSRREPAHAIGRVTEA